MPPQYTVYQVIKEYLNYDDQWEGVRGEYDTREEAREHWQFKQENPDSNAGYYIKIVERDFPACKICNGSGNVPDKQSPSQRCSCYERRRAQKAPTD
ncbi:MAG TPA: hypothetical protein VNO55_13635 [Polyangia bacterium]|nr:hypothetical protein [Polyangia bacterium]